jgi:arylsulfatase A-like enzyme
VLDDVGFSAMSCYGGPIETPNIDRIVDAGLRYTQFHTTALCSPTRSCLLNGRNHTRNSMACITEAAIGFPNASGTIPPENGMLSEVLGERGWNTYMVGKWHLCPTDEMNLAAPRRNWPTGRGFERWYGFLGAETNQWYPDLVYDNHLVDQPRTPEEGYHLTEDITDKALEFIRDSKAVAPEKPFLLDYAPGACHAPHQAPKDWIERFKGRFDIGYEAIREQTLAKQKELGIVPQDTELPPLNPIGTPETRTGPEGKPWHPTRARDRQLERAALPRGRAQRDDHLRRRAGRLRRRAGEAGPYLEPDRTASDPGRRKLQRRHPDAAVRGRQGPAGAAAAGPARRRRAGVRLHGRRGEVARDGGRPGLDGGQHQERLEHGLR